MPFNQDLILYCYENGDSNANELLEELYYVAAKNTKSKKDESSSSYVE